MVKVTVVLILGFGPVSRGLVMMFDTALAFSGGRRDLRLNFTKGFFTGIKPNDYRLRRPRQLISMLYSLNSKYSLRSMYSNGTENL